MSDRDEDFDISDIEEEDGAVEYDESDVSGFRRMQVQIWLTFEDSKYSLFAKVVQFSIILFIIMSIVLMLIQSVPPCYYNKDSTDYLVAYPRECHKRPAPNEEPIIYFILETISIVVFTVEYTLRLIASPATVGLLRFLNPLLAPMNFIDLVAIVPYYWELPTRIEAMTSSESQEAAGFSTQFLRVVRLIRIARVFKVTKSLQGFQVLMRTVYKSILPLAMLVVFVAVLCFLFASLSFTAELGKWITEYTTKDGDKLGFWYRDDKDATPYFDMQEGWYWCVQTLTSVGYGEISPITAAGKVIGTCAALGGVIVLALPITIIGANFDEEFEKNRRWEAFERRSRVTRCRRRKLANGWVKRGEAVSEVDPHASDQAYNVQADLSTLLEDHFDQMREKVDIMLERHVGQLRDKLRDDVEDELARVKATERAGQSSRSRPKQPQQATT